ncbi:MAG: hypothetical protein LUC30_00185, partial [Clostridiales bacterium]|nr:hypothetical protein [Clostridiales bacterium]
APEPSEPPPWDTEPAPPQEPVRQAPPPAKKAASARPASAKRPAPGQSGGGDAAFWAGLLPLLRTRLKPWAYMPLTDSSTVSARLENDTLAIYAADQFVYQTVNKQELLRTIGEAASQKAGRPIQAVAKRGAPPAETASPAKASPSQAKPDLFQELLRTGESVGAEID